MKLTAEQQEVVLEYKAYVRQIAFSLWEWAHIPAKYLQDMRSEAELTLCMAVLDFKPDKGYPIKSKIILDVKRRMFKLIKEVQHSFHNESELGGKIVLSEIVLDYDGYDPMLDVLGELMTYITDNQRNVIELRYGLSGQLPMSIREVAKVLGKVKSVPEVAEKRAIKHMRELYQERTNNVVA